ncbi:hypothetical protein OG252_33285 [Streptomyces sp. NBC_01352]|uniref:hypothetical protein n=1 Tax=Streptomyces sp. NBC_01352 TaxID=2903834 RepID=UPI002E3600A7|nr:hypothetical protein [Streptomyces sp. NBC_01352]
MSVRSRAARQRRTRIGRIARHLRQVNGQVRPGEVIDLAVGCGIKTSREEVVHVLTRLRMHRR